MAYAILRIEKIKHFSSLKMVSDHNHRHFYTDNADPTRRHLNRCLIGTSDIVHDVKQLYASKQIDKFRKNGVLAIELLLTFSPEWLKEPSGQYCADANARVKSWIQTCLIWAKKQFGDNVVNCVYHGDERTPHLHFVLGVSYWDKKRHCWRLSADRFFGTRAKLTALQSSHAQAVEPLGLQRGIQGSRASHQTLQQFYSQLNEAAKVSIAKGLPEPGRTPHAFAQWQSTIRELSDEYHTEQTEQEQLYLAEIEYWKTRYMYAVGKPKPNQPARVTKH